MMAKDTTLEPVTNTDQNKLGLRVEAMVDSVRLFAHSKGLTKYNRQMKRALLPHLEGTDVQNNFPNYTPEHWRREGSPESDR